MKIHLPSRKKILILAANDSVLYFIRTLVEMEKSLEEIVLIVDSARPINNLDLLPNELDIRFVDSSDNDLPKAIAIEESTNICCVFGWYAILKKEFIDLFRGCIFNMHFGDLPCYRGAGGFSWQILNGTERLGAFIHQMIPKVDAGAVVCSVESELVMSDPYPQDFIDLSCELANAVAIKFATLLHYSSVINAKCQDESQAEYLPKLLTSENGKIDFRFGCEEVARFIRAFSYPYPGASCIYEGEKIHIRRVKIIRFGIFRHPFGIGLIINRDPSGLRVLLRDGVILIQDIRDSHGERIDYVHFRIGNRLGNTQEELTKALLFRP